MSAPVRAGKVVDDDAPPVLYVPVPGIRVEATYPATDGRCPEVVTVTWEREGTPPAGWVEECIKALAMVPYARSLLEHEPR